MKVEYEILDHRLKGWGFPHYGSAGAAGLDLFACVENTTYIMPQMNAVLIRAGFKMRPVDTGVWTWVGLILPRSGMGHKQGLVMGNGTGVIDQDYEGEIFVSAWNRNPHIHGVKPIRIEPGERIAQLLIVPVARPDFVEVESLARVSERGAGGFGSTGR